MFADMMNDRVTLVKKDGTVVKDNIKAIVQPKLIVIDDVKLPIETGDRLLRSLPSKLVEDYIVDDPGYHSGLSGIAAHFQVKVRRSDAPVATPSTIINNLQGQNARVNINSTDNSQNLAFTSDGGKIFEDLRAALDAVNINAEDDREIRRTIDEMQHATSKESFKGAYVNFMSTAADHVAVFGPLLGALAGLLA